MTLPAYYSLVINNSQYCQSRVPPPLIHLSDQPAQPLQEGPEGLMLMPPSYLGLAMSGKEGFKLPESRLLGLR